MEMSGKSFDVAPPPRQGFPCFEGLGWETASDGVDPYGKRHQKRPNEGEQRLPSCRYREIPVATPMSTRHTRSTNQPVDKGAGTNVVERRGQAVWVGLDCARAHTGVFDRRPWRVGWQRRAFGTGRVD